MQSRKKQQGLTFISWLVILTILGVFVLVGIKITPVYLEHFAVKKTLESMQREPLIGRKTIPEIRRILFRRFDMNSIYDMTKDDIKIQRSGSSTKITVAYEERRNLFGNLSLVMTFEDSIELASN
jgi:hypothetical protein